jgi:ubiquinone/menaquinone biosynthesis C-methylase UbiE
MIPDQDSPRQWVRGPATNEVEKNLVGAALHFSRRGRILEVGAGTGRLLPTLGDWATELYAVDTNREYLAEAGRQGVPDAHLSRVRATAEHLPWKNQGMSAIVLLRVFHRLASPPDALREFRRVIEPDGVIIMSYVAVHSLKTFYHRLWRHLRRRADHRAPALSRREFRSVVRSAGLTQVQEFGCGFEELPLLELLPIRFLVRFGKSLGRAPFFPTRLVVLRAI